MAISPQSLKASSSEIIKIVVLSVLWLFAIGAVIWFAIQINELIFLFLFACVLSAALYPPVNWLKSRHLPRHASILIFYLIFIGFASLIVILLTDMVSHEGKQFIQHFPHYINRAERVLKSLPFGFPEVAALDNLSQYAQNVLRQGSKVLLASFSYVLSFLHGLVSIVTLLVFSFFLLSDTEYFQRATLKLLPQKHRLTFLTLSKEIALKVGAYVRGQFLVMFCVGTLTCVGLSLIGVKYALILGLITFMLDIIPIVGPLVSGLIGVTIALGQDPMLGVWAALVYFVAQNIENYVLVPTILGRSVGIHSFWILTSILIAEPVFGIKGILIAVPTAVTIKILIEALYIKNVLGETPETEPLEISSNAAPGPAV